MIFWQKFWQWYERHIIFNTVFTSALFLLQLIHLTWLATDVIIPKLGGPPLFPVSNFWQFIIIVVDYTEIPALISASLVYVNDFRKKPSIKPVLYFLFLNTQWLHLFWITDEFVVEQFTGATASILPAWLAWIAIGIDYLELPVIYDTILRSIKLVREKTRLKKKD